MITVTVFINDQPIFTRTARNTGVQNDKGCYMYKVDTGCTLEHCRDDGAIRLAHKLLDTVEEP
jgi:hypothetical protein